MKIVIVGSGLMGVAAAYVLQRRGHKVVVLERQEGPGRETSYANGTLLTPSMPEPWNSPGCWQELLRSLCRSDAALQLHWRTLPGLANWGIEFLRNSSIARFERNSLKNLRLALYSLKMMAALRLETGIEYARIARGTLRLFREANALKRADSTSHRWASEGLAFRTLSAREAVDLEPALAPIVDKLAGAIHYPNDESGDAYRFCVALAEVARDLGVEFRFGVPITSIAMRSGRVAGVLTERGCLIGDRYVVAAGSYSVQLLRRVGVRLPVRPAKGYSVTFQKADAQPLLRVPIIDDELHAAVVPFAAGIRVAGTAEFAGYDLTLPSKRVRNLLKLLQQVLPQARFDPEAARAWCGLRPMSADGVPVIGRTPISDLFVNCGHGPLGWTMAVGSAHLLADVIDGGPASVEPADYELRRFY
jgi:D-amino-acid dehydrogenase